MKGLFITPTDLKESSGIDKKVFSQYKALKNNASDIELCYLSKKNKGMLSRKCYEKNLILRKKNINNKLIERLVTFYFNWNFNDILSYIYNEKIDYIYFRYEYASNYGLLNFFKKLKKKNIKIIVEIPTYPYDSELLKGNFFKKLKYFIDKIFRKNLKKYVYKIVTYSDDKTIYDIPTIRLSNGIDIQQVSIIKKNKNKDISFIIVAGIAFWHGIDRFLYSLLQYEKNSGKEKIKFHIVGEGSETPKLKKIVEDNIELQDIVIFHGFKSGEELDEIYNNSNIALGSLGNYRKELLDGGGLKNREYCAKGLPFIISGKDNSFIDCDFVYQVANDDSLLDIEKIIEWYKNLKVTPEEIRKYAEDNLTWDKQMKKVIDNI